MTEHAVGSAVTAGSPGPPATAVPGADPHGADQYEADAPGADSAGTDSAGTHPGGTGAAGAGGTGGGGRVVLAPVAWRPLGVVAGLVAAVLLATNGGYGYHRDELYFLMLRPDWGYRDQPPLTPAIARLADTLFGGSLWGLRVPATLGVLAALLLAALVARELGGGALAQTLAAAGLGTGGATLIFGHVLLTAGFDMVVWLGIVLCAARALLRNQPRWWLLAGAVLGIGLYNKLLVVLLLVGLGAGLLAVGPRRVLLDRWLWAGVGLALLVGAPNLVYQLSHELPQAGMAAAIAEDKGAESRSTFVPFQFLLIGPPLAAVWLAGLVGLLRRPSWRPVRALAVAYLVVCVLVLVSGGQPYYPYGLLGTLFAAGCVVLADWLGRGRQRARRLVVGAAYLLNAVSSAVIALPLVPVGTLGDTPVPGINITAADSVGWPRYVDQVVRAYDALPPADRAAAVVLTANYGEAGALTRLGAGRLPAIYSGHNELGYYGPPPESATVLVGVGVGEEGELRRYFGTCRLAGRLDNGVGVDNEEQGVPIVLCRDRRLTWAELWPEVRHFD
ncbi:glycosyltransferase family 39 protein [Plantactinospora sp. WMMB782]|uniref:glycosyltransferase family 39 protein n=1 Tax=Plantactinospora sp. WMMB782 TaxID=3404121 RepID=UPI003B9360CF